VTARLDADAANVVEEARSLARRYHHRVVDLEHLLLAMLTTHTNEGAPPLPVDGLHRPELRVQLETRLAARPRSALYRDPREVIEPTLCPAVAAALRRAANKRLLAFFRAISLEELFDAVLADPTAAKLIRDVVATSEELEALAG
jgi:ATP-dependent Clp protease ATP-binding subunit ClpA